VLKVSRSNQLVGGKQTQFEYAIADNKIYYDISFVDCAIGKSGKNCPGWHTGLSISSPNVGSPCPALNLSIHRPSLLSSLYLFAM
jgi:hypothetical protein